MSIKEIYRDGFWDAVCEQPLDGELGLVRRCRLKQIGLGLSDNFSTLRLMISIGTNVRHCLLKDAVEPTAKVWDTIYTIRTIRNDLRVPGVLLESGANPYGTLYWVTVHLGEQVVVEYSFLVDLFVLTNFK